MSPTSEQLPHRVVVDFPAVQRNFESLMALLQDFDARLAAVEAGGGGFGSGLYGDLFYGSGTYGNPDA